MNKYKIKVRYSKWTHTYSAELMGFSFSLFGITFWHSVAYKAGSFLQVWRQAVLWHEFYNIPLEMIDDNTK